MQNSKLYSNSNNLQRCDAAEVIEEFSKYLNWKFDGSDKLLDIGCGPGDVLCEIILPKVPKNIQKVLGIDISGEMIESARKNFHKKFIEFIKSDISSVTCCKQLNEQFDNITSFYCLHWIQNQK
jgi:juvenile hormone-III synthase